MGIFINEENSRQTMNMLRQIKDEELQKLMEEAVGIQGTLDWSEVGGRAQLLVQQSYAHFKARVKDEFPTSRLADRFLEASETDFLMEANPSGNIWKTLKGNLQPPRKENGAVRVFRWIRSHLTP